MQAGSQRDVAEIGRLAYLVRLVAGLAFAAVLYFLTVLAFMNSAGSSVLVLVLLAVAGVLVNVVGLTYVMAKFVLVPRLRDAGFFGPLMWLMLALCVFPATAPFFVLALTLIPSGFVRS